MIVELRNNAGPYINRGAATVAEQLDWIERYLTRPGDYYFATERTDDDARVDGLAAIYDVDQSARVGEWGRFVVRQGSNAAVQTALLVYRAAFEVIGLRCLVCRTLVDNAHVLAFHDSCGLVRAAEAVVITHDDVSSRAIEHRLERERWPAVEAKLAPLARRLAARRPVSGVR